MHIMDWHVLGIEPTKDKKAITAAYRQKLRSTNPEDSPEAFKALRAAYEEALALAEQGDESPIRVGSPVACWLENVRAAYHDFQRRIDPQTWRGLVAEDVCQGLDTRPEVEKGLLEFLMEQYFLPKGVWEVLEAAFCFAERKEELCETYPREFVEHVLINGARLEQNLPYDLFFPGRSADDCDTYRTLYYQACQAAPEDIAPILDQIDALAEKHPFGEVLRMQHWIYLGRTEEGIAGLQKLAEKYTDRSAIVMSLASVYLENQEIAQAKALAERVLEREPGNLAAMNTVAKCLAAMGEFQKAKEITYDAIHACGGNPIIMNELAEQMKVWNESLIHQLKDKLDMDPEDTEAAIELAWAYAQNEDTESAFQAAEKIDPQKEDPFSYHNLMGKLYYNNEDYADALQHIEHVEKIIRELEEDAGEKMKKRKKRLPEMLQIQGNCMMQMGLHAQAKEKYHEALTMAPEDTELLSTMGRNLYAMGDYAYAEEILKRLLSVSPGSWYAEFLLALCLYHRRRDGEAYEAVDRALAKQGNDLSLYVLKMQILIRNGVWEGVHEILEYLDESGVPADVSMDYIRAKVTELEKKDKIEAFQMYQKIARTVEAGDFLLWDSELYFRMAMLMGQTLDPSVEDDREILLAIVEKGLARNPHDMDCLSYRAWLMQQGGKIREAIDMYLELDRKYPGSDQVMRGLAELYCEHVQLYAREGLSYFEKCMADKNTPLLCFYAAVCKRHLGDMEGARKYYRMELEMDPDDIDAYRGLAMVSDAEGDYARSLAMLDQAISIMERNNQFFDWLVEHKIQTLRRMGRFEEALSLVDDMIQKYEYDGYQMKFDICCQFGLWGRANGVLEQWKREQSKNPQRTAAAAKLNLLTGSLFKAAVLMGTVKHKLPQDQILAFRMQLNDLDCQYKRQVMHLGRRIQEDPADDNALLCMAQALWHSGQRELARRFAENALERMDELLQQHRTDEAILRTRKCFALALLGREQEARAELEKSRMLPLCHFCEYGSCKDADIYEAMIEEVTGNTDKALVLFRTGKEKWPDDTDFAAGIARLTKRGKKKC